MIPFLPTTKDFPEKSYYGNSSCQTFDSALHAILVEAVEEEPKLHINKSRYFFADTTAENPFSGVIMLPEKEYALMLIEKVIRFIGHELYLFDSKEFFQKVEETYETLNDKRPMWLCYFLITLAVGEQYLNESQDGEIPGMRFFSPAMQLYRNVYEEPTLETVQTILLIAFYQQGLNRANTAFSFYGLAVRSALIMGLHRKRTYAAFSSTEREKRRRVWWTVFVMESIWCAKTGQPIHVNINDIDVAMLSDNSVPLVDGFNTELLWHNARLSIIVGNVMLQIYGSLAESKSMNLTSILKCLLDLDAFKKGLPYNIKNNLLISSDRSTANLYLRINQIVIITTRPLVLSIFQGIIEKTSSMEMVRKACIEAAKENIDILANLKNNGWMSTFGFWDAQYCFSSYLILAMCYLQGQCLKQMHIGRRLNTYMKEAGNFTAKDNEQRLMELDLILVKVSKKSLHMQEDETMQEKRTDDTNVDFEGQNISCYPNISDKADYGNTNSPLTKINSIQSEYDSVRGNISPETWNNLTSNLQFWDSCDIFFTGESSHQGYKDHS